MLLAEVKSLNPDFKSHEIRGKLHTFSLFNFFFSVAIIQKKFFSEAAYTYYKHLNQERSLDERGVAETRKVNRRRAERIRRVNFHYMYIPCYHILLLFF